MRSAVRPGHFPDICVFDAAGRARQSQVRTEANRTEGGWKLMLFEANQALADDDAWWLRAEGEQDAD